MFCFRGCNLPQTNLAWMVGIRSFPFGGGLFSGASCLFQGGYPLLVQQLQRHICLNLWEVRVGLFSMYRQVFNSIVFSNLFNQKMLMFTK